MDPQSPRKAAGSAGRARKRRRQRRFVVLGVFGLVALAVGLVIGANYVGSGEKSARRFVAAWNRGDYRAMYAELTPDAAAATGASAFAGDYQTAMATATATAVRVGKPRQKRPARFVVPVAYTTRIFGPVHGTITLPMADTGDGKRIAWTADLVFPGLRAEHAPARRDQHAGARGDPGPRRDDPRPRSPTASPRPPTSSAQILGDLGADPGRPAAPPTRSAASRRRRPSAPAASSGSSTAG